MENGQSGDGREYCIAFIEGILMQMSIDDEEEWAGLMEAAAGLTDSEKTSSRTSFPRTVHSFVRRGDESPGNSAVSWSERQDGRPDLSGGARIGGPLLMQLNSIIK